MAKPLTKKPINLNKNNSDWREEIPPSEDLMREHGILNRVLLIYEEILNRLEHKKPFEIALLYESASIIRNFIEEYHEELEEKYIFPLFQKAGKKVELVNTLWDQHNAGKEVTKKILELTKTKSLSAANKKQLIHYINEFITMYRPHEAREDTELFPEIRNLVSEEEFKRMGELFEKKEDEFFGEHGFETMVKRVTAIEKKLGINNLKQFTPKDVKIKSRDED